VPQRFPKEIGVITGIVGAAGGVGGFFLPNLLGGLKGQTGDVGAGFAVFAVLGLACVGLMLMLRARWEATFLVGLHAPQTPSPVVPVAEGATTVTEGSEE